MRVQRNKSINQIEFIYFIKFGEKLIMGPYARKPNKAMLRGGELIIRRITKENE